MPAAANIIYLPWSGIIVIVPKHGRYVMSMNIIPHLLSLIPKYGIPLLIFCAFYKVIQKAMKLRTGMMATGLWRAMKDTKIPA